MNLQAYVVAPTGRDSELIVATLQQSGVDAEASKLDDVLSYLETGALLGCLLIAEEALSMKAIQALGEYTQRQPSWSDFPILILTGTGRETVHSAGLHSERLPLGIPILLERPIRTASLVSNVKAAVRARARQYQIKEAVAELKDERELLQAMLDNLPVGVVFAKASGKVDRCNRRLEEILRHPLIPTADIDSHGKWIAFHSDGRRVAGHEFPLVRAIKTGRSQRSEEYLYQRGDGTKSWISLAAAPVINDLGEVTGGVVTVSDIDLQKRSESALIQSEKLAAVGKLAASISHEINNPLEAVTNLLYLIRQQDSLSKESQELLDVADQELARVSQIVSHTLQFHRQATKPRPVSAREILTPTLGLYAGRLVNSNINLVVQHRSEKPLVCHEGEIRQVLNNLIGNAIEAMKLGGRLIIRTKDSCFWKSGIRGVRITIADTGTGIESHLLADIFNAFFTTKGINGTGLGLWIAKGIVDKHGGLLQVFSTTAPSRSGTVFSLLLPTDASSRS